LTGHRSRYRELEAVVEALMELDHTDAGLAEKVMRIKRKGRKALDFKEAPRSPTIDLARKLGTEANVARANIFRAKLAPVVAEIQAAGIKGYGEIAAELNKRGFTAPRGNPWSKGTVGRFINGN
jgi:hypothetical protein